MNNSYSHCIPKEGLREEKKESEQESKKEKAPKYYTTSFPQSKKIPLSEKDNLPYWW